MRLQDGRELGYAEFGDPDGVPCFSFHGIPGSRLEGALFHEAARALGIRLIEVDRPGLGLSSPAPGRTVASFADDVRELADGLGIDGFAVFGWSGGGPYALGCAARLGDRVRTTVVASSPTPGTPGDPTWRHMRGFRRAIWRLGTRRTWPLVAPMWVMGSVVLLLGPLARTAWKRQPVATRPPEQLVAGMHEAWRQGARYVAQDVHVAVRDWGFDLGEVCGVVHLWHGEDDVAVPVSMGRVLSERIATCEARFAPGGHRLCVERAAEVLAAVSARH